MNYSRQSTVSDGTLEILDISIAYFERGNLFVLLDGVPTDAWEWVGILDTIRFPFPIPAGTEVIVQRHTQLDSVIHEFGKGAAFTSKSMDEDFRQMLFLAQENAEGAGSHEFFADVNMHGFKIRNLAPGLLPDDAVTVSQLEDARDAAAEARSAASEANAAAVESRMLRTDLAEQGGAFRVGFDHPGLLVRNVESRLRDRISVLDFPGVDPSANVDSTAGIQAAIEFAKLNRKTLYIPRGSYLITRLYITDAVYTFNLHCEGAFFFCTSMESVSSMLEITNCVAFNMTGSYAIHGQDKPNYDSLIAIKVKEGTSQSTTRVNLYNPTFYNAKCGISNGDVGVDFQCSEINIFGANWFRCPVAAYNAGANTGMQFIGCNLVSERNPALVSVVTNECAVHLEGGFVKVTGGSIVTNPTCLYAIVMEPTTSTLYGPIHSSISVTGAHVEVNSGLINVANSRNIPSVDSSSSSATFVGNTGFCGAPAAHDFALVQDSSWGGCLTLLGNNWYAGSPRTAWNISSGSSLARIYVDKVSLGKNFRNWVGGVFGGQLVHEFIPALSAYSLGVTFGASVANVVKYTSYQTLDELGRYSHCYDTATGVFTVPPGGLMELDINATIVTSGPDTADFYLRKLPTGAETPYIVAFGQYSNGVAKLNVKLAGLLSGDELSIVFTPYGADCTADTGVYQSLVLSASTR